MSVVTVQIGQCGNQIGTSLFSLLAHDANHPPPYTSADTPQNLEYKQDVMARYFTERRNGVAEAKVVLVDMEEKVIKQCKNFAKQKGGWKFPENSEYVRKSGSANNWALGYTGSGEVAARKIIELCRKQLEQCDHFGGFLILMSLAGGTGSGLGAYMTHALHDEFPEAITANHIVFPHSTGEVIVQNYNAVLTLSHLQQSSDIIIAHQNDNLLQMCQKLLALKNVSFTDINGILAHKLASILQPACRDGHCNTNVLYDVVQSVAAHPAYKMVSVKNIPFINDSCMVYSTYVWHALTKHMRQMLIADSAMESGVNWEIKLPTPSSDSSSNNNSNKDNFDIRLSNFNKSVANLLILRGKDIHEADTEAFRSAPLYSTQMPFPYTYTEWKSSRPFNGYDKSLALVSNSQTFVRPLNYCVEKAWNMFHARAYLHQYEKCGVTKDDFVNSFGAVEQILSDYSSL